MNTNARLLFGAACLLAFASCGKLDFKKTRSGLLYKVIATKDSKGSTGKPGNVIKLYFTEKLNDSLIQSNYGKMPAYSAIQASAQDYSPADIFPYLRKGDSAVAVILVDSLVAKGRVQQLPPFMKKGDRIVYAFKVADLFTVDSLARADNRSEGLLEQERQQKESAIQGEKEQKEIQEYLAAHKIDAKKTPKGSWIVVKDAGSGMTADSGKLVSMKYRGQTFDGTVFDTNMDTSFHHAEPYIFIQGGGNVIPGLDDAIHGLGKGAKLTAYIPAVLGYGPNPMSRTSKGYDNLIFEVELLDVKDRPQPKPLQKVDTTQPKKSNR